MKKFIFPIILAAASFGPGSAHADFVSNGAGYLCTSGGHDQSDSCSVNAWDNFSDGGDGNDHWANSWESPLTTWRGLPCGRRYHQSLRL